MHTYKVTFFGQDQSEIVTAGGVDIIDGALTFFAPGGGQDDWGDRPVIYALKDWESVKRIDPIPSEAPPA